MHQPETHAPARDGALEEAIVIYPGAAKGRPTIELRTTAEGFQEAFLAPFGAAPIPTKVRVVPRGTKYFIACRIRAKEVLFKPEEVVRQHVLNHLMDDLHYPLN